jgi:hypothetical protein
VLLDAHSDNSLANENWEQMSNINGSSFYSSENENAADDI